MRLFIHFDKSFPNVYIVAMRIETTRDLKIFRTLLNAAEPVTSQELGVQTSTSSRTMKSEIARLNAWLQQENVGRIEAVKGQGYIL